MSSVPRSWRSTGSPGSRSTSPRSPRARSSGSEIGAIIPERRDHESLDLWARGPLISSFHFRRSSPTAGSGVGLLPPRVISTGGFRISDSRVNEQIRISPIRLIGADGEQIGVVSLDEARERAREADLDLVEVAARARPPVVKIMDWGKHRYEQQKKAREAKKKQHTVELKEVQLRPRTDDHDFDVKLRRARRFLEEGNVVRVVLRYRGRELRRPEIGVATLDRMIEETKDIARVEQRSNNIEGRRLFALLEPSNSAT
ncbi:MAG: translation initiation factor IF-3 [Longimicrobiales bacterium]|nr:translation initiation factor IF-3 [Longimicrobiales bacterium]